MNTILRTLAALAAFTVVATARADSPHEVVITEARANESGTALQVTGVNFSGGTPKLTLGMLAAPLIITHATPTQIEALLPAGIAPGTYLLTLSVSRKKDSSKDSDDNRGDEFWVTLGAAGTPGKDGKDGKDGLPGPTGPIGLQGATGPAGSQGPAGPTGAAGPQGATGPAGAQGPAGAGATLASLGSLAGLACNVGVCTGVTALAIDAVTRAVSLTCSIAQRTLRLRGDDEHLAPLEGMGISARSSDPMVSSLGMSVLPNHENGSVARAFCNGQPLTVTVNRGRTGSSPGGLPVTVSGACSGTVPPTSESNPGQTFTCDIIMDADYEVLVH